jgi:hypothetical protein
MEMTFDQLELEKIQAGADKIIAGQSSQYQ